jgi:hypothetical protein
MGTTGTFYDDPGADYFTRLHPVGCPEVSGQWT